MSELLLLRLVVGIIFIYHAIPKLQNPQAMASGIGWQKGQVLGLGIVEFVSALGLIGGLAVRIAALLLSCVMAGAIYHKMKKWNVPFMSNNSTGWEFDLLLLVANITIYLKW